MAILVDRLDEFVTVDDEEISEAIVAAARALEARRRGRRRGLASRRSSRARSSGTGRTVALLSGGNIDPTLLISVAAPRPDARGPLLALRTRLPDRPGELIKLLSLIAEERGNIVSVEHHREGLDIPVGESEVELTLTMRGREHCDQLVGALEAVGYAVNRLH